MRFVGCADVDFLNVVHGNGTTRCTDLNTGDPKFQIFDETDINALVDDNIQSHIDAFRQELIENPLPNSEPFDLSQLDGDIATGLFVAGFLLTLTPWATAWGFNQLLRLVR